MLDIDQYIDNLNQEQKKAATYPEGSVLVLAAAGSGKTSTLTCRIAYLIEKMGVSAHSILAVTFTNKAAKEMIGRLQKMGIDTKQLWVGTFHGICNKILRYHAIDVGLRKNFYIMDQQEQLSFLKRVCRSNGYDPKVLNVSDLQDRINDFKENGLRAQQIQQGTIERKIYELYENACLKENAVDFAELMLACYELFKKKPEIGEAYSEKFKHILIDEFQDTNELQYKWLKILGQHHKNLFAVGDDDQCLPSGTLISTPQGLKLIEDIHIGELVYSKIGEHIVEKKVLDKFEKLYDGNLLTFATEQGLSFTSTQEHNWFVGDVEDNPSDFNISVYREDEAKKSHLHKEGDDFMTIILCAMNKNEVAIHLLRYTTYDLYKKRLLENHGFNFKENLDGMYVFEMESEEYEKIIKTTKKIQTFITDLSIDYKANVFSYYLQQIRADQIKVGMRVIDQQGNIQIIKSIKKEKRETMIYDLNIENTHNFFANYINTHNSIYSFRGAKPENLNLFKKEYHAELIKIEKNYRSDAYILEAANEVIKNNTNRQGKNLVPTKLKKHMISLYKAFNDEQESGFIGNEIKKLRRNNIPYKNMAILYRTNGQSRSLEKSLTSLNIPYIIYGGFRFFDRQEVKHAMAYLRLAHNKDDNMAFLRVANVPARAIGESALKKLEIEAQKNKVSLFEMVKQSDAKTMKKFASFIQTIELLENSCKNKGLKQMVEIAIVQSGLEAMYENDKKEGEERLDNLYELISAADVFVLENPHANLDEFLAFSTLETNVETKKRDENADAVKLMTIHSSKGLEFQIVFLTGLEEQLFPHMNSFKEPEKIEEERRLMYVAITRAKEKLYLSCSEERLLHGQRVRLTKSRFLKEIPGKLITQIN